MALLNPPELRPSITLTIVRYLGAQRGQQDSAERLLSTLAPASLKGADPQHDVSVNLRAAIELGLVLRSDDKVSLADGVLPAVQDGQGALVKLLRERVFTDSLNSTAWRSQVGARDLTNALSWFLTLSPTESPIQMEGGPRSAAALQTKDFGSRQDEDGDESSNWPIGNPTRWGAFRRWACSLGFAWANPNGHLVPDPTTAIRDALADVFASATELTAREFVSKVGECVPVLDGGRYREFVMSNWERPAVENRLLTVSLTDALERLTNEKSILVDDRADAARVAKADRSTFSHVRLGGRQ
jgi:hypothetical protein